MTSNTILIGATESGQQVHLPLATANRHGLVAGATGTGKTVTLQVLAEAFSAAGVPVIAPDIKGDLSGILLPATPNDRLTNRASKCGIEPYTVHSSPATLWKLVRGSGIPLRTTVSEVGPTLLSRVLDLNETQEAVLTLLFRAADEEGLLLLNWPDLESLVAWATTARKELEASYGAMHAATIGAIHRKVQLAGERGIDQLFGEPAVSLEDFIRTTEEGAGVVNLLHAEEALHNPHAYTTFLLWLLSELFEELPEVGDLEKPKLVFFFDEAHLLFQDAPSELLERIETVVRLIRSKGVGLFFVTQRPGDIPDRVASQLGTRVQHALRAFTPAEEKHVRVAANSFRKNESFSTEEAITQLGVGEALISVLQEDGVPSVVERVLVRPPSSQIGPLRESQRTAAIASSSFGQEFFKEIDSESAEELLQKRLQEKVSERPRKGGVADTISGAFGGALKSFLRSIAYNLGKEVSRGILGTIKR